MKHKPYPAIIRNVIIALILAIIVSPALAGTVTVNSGGTLKGDGGTITGDVTIESGGTIAPGASVGTLSVNDDVTVSGTMHVEIDGTTVDLLNVSGALDISAATLDIDEDLPVSAKPCMIAGICHDPRT